MAESVGRIGRADRGRPNQKQVEQDPFLSRHEKIATLSIPSVGSIGSQKKKFARVIVTSVSSPSSFHCIFDGVGSPDKLFGLVNRMTEYYSQGLDESMLDNSDYPLEGRVLACAYPKDDSTYKFFEWFRATVLFRVSLDEYKVTYLDSGKTMVS